MRSFAFQDLSEKSTFPRRAALVMRFSFVMKYCMLTRVYEGLYSTNRLGNVIIYAGLCNNKKYLDQTRLRRAASLSIYTYIRTQYRRCALQSVVELYNKNGCLDFVITRNCPPYLCVAS